MSFIFDTLTYIAGFTARRSTNLQKTIRPEAQKHTHIASIMLSNGEWQPRPSNRSISCCNGLVLTVREKRIHLGVSSSFFYLQRRTLFQSTIKQKKYRCLYPAMQFRSFSNKTQGDSAGGDIVKGGKAGRDINKLEVKGNYTGRD